MKIQSISSVNCWKERSKNTTFNRTLIGSMRNWTPYGKFRRKIIFFVSSWHTSYHRYFYHFNQFSRLYFCGCEEATILIEGYACWIIMSINLLFFSLCILYSYHENASHKLIGKGRQGNGDRWMCSININHFRNFTNDSLAFVAYTF